MNIIQLNRVTQIVQLRWNMISFDDLILGSGTPIYSQIIQYLKHGIVAGTIVNGDELPSRRVLSALLGVNPNTIQKAYRLLEEEGLICSHAGAKSYVSVTPEQRDLVRQQLLEEETKTMVDAMKGMGISLEEAIRLIGRFW